MDVVMQQGQAIPRDRQIAVQLSAEQWNIVLMIMRKAPVPHEIVDPVLRNIQQQCLNATGP